jgi:hypothetical protein
MASNNAASQRAPVLFASLKLDGTTISTDREVHNISEFWIIMPERSKFATTNAWGETLP